MTNSHLSCLPGACTDWVLKTTGARTLREVELLQPLWGGLGSLFRVSLDGAERRSVILKYVAPPAAESLEPGEARKRRSYEVEQRWYERYAWECDARCRVAQGLGWAAFENALVLLLEDLTESGFQVQRSPTERHLKSGLEWLAAFHAHFLGRPTVGLWPRGTYWELDYRKEEHQRTEHPWFRERAPLLDEALKGAEYETFVHGDAKAGNFLWQSPDRVAVVDFQWVGGGCGVRDVTLLLDRCLGEEGCLAQYEAWLDLYFRKLHENLGGFEGFEGLNGFDRLEAEWRRLFPIAWCDHERLWFGWGRGQQQIGPFTARMMKLADTTLS